MFSAPPKLGIIISLMVIISMLPLFTVGESTPSIAITGSFYKYEYVLSPNTSIEGKDIYIAVLNKANKTINIELGYEAPDFINISFSYRNFTLDPGEYKIVYIRISALPNAIPGEYEVKVYANIVMRSVEGKVILVPGAGQRTIVRIVGPTGRLVAETIDKEGKHVNTEIQVLRKTLKGEYTYTINKTGFINISLPPGQYIVRAMLVGQVLAQEEVNITENSTEKVFLIVSTVWFDYFDVLPYYRDDNIVFAEVIGVVKNVYKPLNNTSIILLVKYNGSYLENLSIVNIPVLSQGRTEYKYRYIPVDGWRNGTYEFKLLLTSGSRIYAETVYKTINVIISRHEKTVTSISSNTATITVSNTTTITSTIEKIEKSPTDYTLIIIVVAIIVVAVLLAIHRRRAKTT